MSTYINIQEFAQIINKSEKTARRLIKKLATQLEVEKNPLKDEFIKQEKLPNGFIYLINKEYALNYKANYLGSQNDNLSTQKENKADSQLPIEEEKAHLEKGIGQVDSYPKSEISLDYIETLKKQLETKDQQLKIKDEQMTQLIERNREANLIINNLQNKMLLLEQPAKKESFLSRLFGKKQS